MKTCSDCKFTLPLTDFYTKGAGKHKVYHEAYCKSCCKKRVAKRKRDQIRTPEYRSKVAAKLREHRSDPANRAKYIILDSKKNDRKALKENDLTIPFVEQLISQQCFYCGETSIKKSLDRIDNSLGHIQSNVVVSCVRCNLVRGNMPFSAWLEVAKGMKSAREKGLFADWISNNVGSKVKTSYGGAGPIRTDETV